MFLNTKYFQQYKCYNNPKDTIDKSLQVMAKSLSASTGLIEIHWAHPRPVNVNVAIKFSNMLT